MSHAFPSKVGMQRPLQSSDLCPGLCRGESLLAGFALDVDRRHLGLRTLRPLFFVVYKCLRNIPPGSRTRHGIFTVRNRSYTPKLGFRCLEPPGERALSLAFFLGSSAERSSDKSVVFRRSEAIRPGSFRTLCSPKMMQLMSQKPGSSGFLKKKSGWMEEVDVFFSFNKYFAYDLFKGGVGSKSNSRWCPWWESRFVQVSFQTCLVKSFGCLQSRQDSQMSCVHQKAVGVQANQAGFLGF